MQSVHFNGFLESTRACIIFMQIIYTFLMVTYVPVFTPRRQEKIYNDMLVQQQNIIVVLTYRFCSQLLFEVCLKKGCPQMSEKTKRELIRVQVVFG
jgi:hypothetical protein